MALDPAFLGKALKNAKNGGDLNLSPEELAKFEESFKQKEFCELFAEYAAEICNPAARKEQEAYIAQLEKEQKIPEDKELIRPQAGFVVKTHKVKKGAGEQQKDKLFINIVQSTAMGKPTCERSAQGESWSIPRSIGPVRMEKDKSGANTPTFDCCFHPEALVRSQMDERYKNLVVQIALEAVAARYKEDGQVVELSPDYHVVKGRAYKSGDPVTMMVAKGAGKKPPSSSSTSSSASSSGVNPPPSEVDSKAATSKPAQAAATSSPSSSTTTAATPTVMISNNAPAATKKEEAKQKEQESSKITEVKKEEKKKQGKAIPSPTTPIQPPSSPAPSSGKPSAPNSMPSTPIEPPSPPPSSEGPKAPEYSLTERGQIDLSEHMMGEAGAPKASSIRPKELVIKIQTPLVRSANDLELDISERQLLLASVNKSIYTLTLRLPYPVMEEKGGAKFDKTKKVLTVTLPVSRKDIALPRPIPPIPSSDDFGAGKKTEGEEEGQKTKKGEEEGEGEGEGVEGTKVDTPLSSHKGEPRKPEKDHGRWIGKEEGQEGRLVLDQAEVAKIVAENAAKIKQGDAEAKQQQQEGEEVVEEEGKISSPLWKVDTGKDFNPTDAFQGAQPGYVFKKGDLGGGYYRDIAAISTKKDEVVGQSTSTGASAAPITSSSSAAKAIEKSSSSSSKKRPTFQCKQKEDSFALIVDVKQIDPASIQVDWGEDNTSRMATIDFGAKGDSPSSSATEYQLTLHLHHAIRPNECRYEPATSNLLIVLSKAKPGVMWPNLEAPSEAASAGVPKEMKMNGEGAGSTKKAAVPTQTFTNKVMFELD